ncbi:hypothetical protein ACOSP7_014227 [Xanthoceras sorbifolium]
MDEAKGSSNAPAPFLTKTYEMVDDPVTNSVVSWSRSGCSFVVWNPTYLATDLLPKYFKHNNFSSFIRQLNTYGFRKIDPEQWEFANEEFIRGQRHLLKNIYRRKPVHSHSSLNQGALTETERNQFEGKIERLKKDKTLLQLELKRRQSENQGFQFQVQSLCERLQNLECRQMQLINLLKKPVFAFDLMKQQSQLHNKRRRQLLNPSYFDFANQKENSDTVLCLEQIEKLESSLNFWASFLYGIGEVFSEEVYDFGVLPHLSVEVAEEDTASYDEPCSVTHSTDFHSKNHVDDATPDFSGIDVAEAQSSSVPTKANDVFWELLLMETPDPADTKETQ